MISLICFFYFFSLELRGCDLSTSADTMKKKEEEEEREREGRKNVFFFPLIFNLIIILLKYIMCFY